MANPIEQLNKVFDSRIRIGIMSALAVNEHQSFNDLKALTETTDGNLASHLKTLEENSYVQAERNLAGRKATYYHITPKGEKAFRAHLHALEQIIKSLP